MNEVLLGFAGLLLSILGMVFLTKVRSAKVNMGSANKRCDLIKQKLDEEALKADKECCHEFRMLAQEAERQGNRKLAADYQRQASFVKKEMERQSHG